MTTDEQRPQDAQQTSTTTTDDSVDTQPNPEQTFVLSTNDSGVKESLPPEVNAEVPVADSDASGREGEAGSTSVVGEMPVSSQPETGIVSEVSNTAPVSQPADVQQSLSASPVVPAETPVDSVPSADVVDAALQTSVETGGLQDTARSADRLREKLGVRSDEKARGSEDVKSQRPETPTYEGPIDIPAADELDASIEEQINAAMTGEPAEAPAAVPLEPVAAADGGEQQSGGPAVTDDEVQIGSKVRGVVQQIHHDDVFLDAGLRSSLLVSLKQFPDGKPPAAGDQLEVVIDSIDGDGLLRARLPRAKHKASGDWSALATGQVVDCIVTGTNKGGLQVTVSNLKGFLPASQVDLGYVSNLESFVGQKLTVQVTEVNPRKRNLVVSRRVLLQAEREEAEGELWKTLEVGQEMEGTVKTIKNYGAFVSLGAIDGFLHIGEMSWSRINHPNDVLREGQEIQVKILKLDEEKKRISLGMKQLVQNPWQSASEKYASERIVSGRISRIADFGAFVELEPGIEGMVHISELAWRRVGSVKEVLSEGETHDFKVIEVDPKRKRVSLSLKALEQRPESEKPDRESAPEESAPPRRKPSSDLRGGTGIQGQGSGLFGNPSDFS
ncbi:MAG: S1 RNA-binding domain-containing protein [Planctomycetaceae bacterium]